MQPTIPRPVFILERGPFARSKPVTVSLKSSEFILLFPSEVQSIRDVFDFHITNIGSSKQPSCLSRFLSVHLITLSKIPAAERWHRS